MGTSSEHHHDCRRFLASLSDYVDGVLVLQVDPGGSAHKAGIQPGQVLRQVGDVPINGLKRLREIAPSLAGPLKVFMAGEKQNDQQITLP